LHCPCGPRDVIKNPTTGTIFYYTKGPDKVGATGESGCTFKLSTEPTHAVKFYWHQDYYTGDNTWKIQYNAGDYKFRTPFCSIPISNGGSGNRNRVLPRGSKIDKCSDLAAISCGMKLAFKYCDMNGYT